MVYQKIIQVMEEIQAFGKIKREEIVPTLLPLLTKYKLSIKPAEISDYKYINQESSFLAKYELVDTEDPELQSIIVEVPAGGFDSEKKGRSTYMATTGAYRQALQQIFVIPIEEDGDNVNQTNNTQNKENNKNSANNQNKQDSETDSISAFDEFEGNIENTNEQSPQKNVEDFTEDDIDAEFANF